MAQGKATVSNRNLAQGEINAVEKIIVFVGVAEINKGKLLNINTQSDFVQLLGNAPFLLKQLNAAKANGGQNWQAKVLVLNESSETVTSETLDFLTELATDLAKAKAEGFALCLKTETESLKDLIEESQMLCEKLVNDFAQPMFCLLPHEPLDDESNNDFIAAVQAEIEQVVANRVILTPMTHSNETNLGVLAGRLCRHDVSIADKPMRVLTGVLADIGETNFSDADLGALDAIRCSVPQTYINYPGIYWGDANTLDAPANDFTLLENLRVADYAGRRIRVRAITMIADRAINNTEGSIAYTKNEFMLILKRMAKATTFNGRTYPGMIKPPKENAVVIKWMDNKTLDIYFSFQPYESPVEINANITVDLSQEN